MRQNDKLLIMPENRNSNNKEEVKKRKDKRHAARREYLYTMLKKNEAIKKD